MKVWAGVYLYEGLINEVKVFASKSKALEWFNSIVEAVGGPDVSEDGDYEVTDKVMKFFDSLGREDTEVYIEYVDIETVDNLKPENSRSKHAAV